MKSTLKVMSGDVEVGKRIEQKGRAEQVQGDEGKSFREVCVSPLFRTLGPSQKLRKPSPHSQSQGLKKPR